MGQMISELSHVFQQVLTISAMAGILVCLILIIKWMFKDKLNIRWQYCLWMLVMIRLVLPWTPESPISLYNLVHLNMESPQSLVPAAGQTNNLTIEPSYTAKEHAPGPGSRLVGTEHVQQPDHTATNSDAAYTPNGFDILMLIWLLGVFVIYISILVGHLKFKKRIGKAVRVTNPHIIHLFEQCKQTMNIRKQITIMETNGIGSPTLYGAARPQLLLPAEAIACYSDKELTYIFMHELSHEKRKDIATNWIMSVLLGIHWFNPLLWYAFYRMREDQEMACDALTLSYLDPDDCSDYGHTILKQLEKQGRFASSPAAAGFAGGKSQLKRRIRLIAMFNRASYRWSLLGLVLVILIAAIALTNAIDRDRGEARSPSLVDTLTNGETFRFRGIDWFVSLEEVLEHEGGNGEDLVAARPDMMINTNPVFFEDVGLTVDRTHFSFHEEPAMLVAGEYWALFEDEEQYLASVERVKQTLASEFNHMTSTVQDAFSPLPQTSDSIIWWAEDGSRLTLSVLVNAGQSDENPPYMLGIEVSGPTKHEIDEFTTIESMLQANRLIDREYRVTLMYPKDWQRNDSYGDRYEGEDGFLQLSAAKGNSIDSIVERDINHHIQPYGNEPQVESVVIDGYDARFIIPSDDQPAEMKMQASLIVEYPEPVEIYNELYDYFILWADKDHIREIAGSLMFHSSITE